MTIVDFQSRIAVSHRLSTHLSLYLLLLAYLRLVLFREQWCLDVGEGKRVEHNGARRGLVSGNKEHGRTSFQSTGEALVARRRRYSAMLSEL